MIIHLISSPRNVSTAFMYSFAQRTDTKVMDEPFYGHYLNRVPIEHPGKQDIIRSMEIDFDQIVKQISVLHQTHENVFVKNMAHHLFDLNLSFTHTFFNLIFIRNPAQIITSFSKVIEAPTLRDIGIKHQLEQFDTLSKESTHPTIVIDSADLIANPEAFLKKLCNRLNLSFDPHMLGWKSGGIPEDGIWAKHWYKNVHNSTGFNKSGNEEPKVPAHLHALLEEAMPYYLELKKQAV
jgi:hypothetical protein